MKNTQDSHVGCPLCKSVMEYRYEPHSNTHAWVCPSCPAVLFEFYAKEQIFGIQEVLK